MTIGQKIKLRREELRISQNELALRADISPQAIRRLEQDVGFTYMNVLAKICAVMDLSLDYLFQDMVEQYKNKFGVLTAPDKYQYGVFYGNLQTECMNKNINIRGLLRSCGLGEDNLSRWKTGVRPRTRTINKIAKSLGVTAGYLLKKH